MSKQAIAVVGTYRKGRVIDCAVSEILKGLQAEGMTTEIVYLLDAHIEFCTNCRACTQDPGEQRGDCAIEDDMKGILQKIDAADVVVLASPINYGTVTALMKRFIERLVGAGYWPWDSHGGQSTEPKQSPKELFLSHPVPARPLSVDGLCHTPSNASNKPRSVSMLRSTKPSTSAWSQMARPTPSKTKNNTKPTPPAEPWARVCD